MKLSNLFEELSLFSFNVDESYVITGISFNLLQYNDEYSFIGESIIDVMEQVFLNEEFKNKRFMDTINSRLKASMDKGESRIDYVTVTDESLSVDYFFNFSLGFDAIFDEKRKTMIKFANFEVKNSRKELYENIFGDYSDIFESYNTINKVGKFVIDYSTGKGQFYGNSVISEFTGLDTTEAIPKELLFMKLNVSQNLVNKTAMLMEGIINKVNEQAEYKGKHYQIEAKVVKSVNDKPMIIGGMVRDITLIREFDSIKNLHAIYDLAISSGNIGVFYYDVDQHGSSYFEANDIYADLLGIEPNEYGLYNFSDFEESIIDIEQELNTNRDIKKTLDNLITGAVDGTTDDIIKIYNKVEDKELYLLSSSKIETRYEDGSPNRFGGIVIDITARIMSERNRIEFAHTDELTRLANKRKLEKDMQKRSDGIGMFFDLDDFKMINDEFGHSVGDEALKLFSEALKRSAFSLDDVYPYRLYGDEFFVFYENATIEDCMNYEAEVHRWINRLLESFDEDIKLEASMGLGQFISGMNVDDFVKEADYSMYEVKIKKKKSR